MYEKRTLCQLLDRAPRVFIRLVNGSVWSLFLAQAKCEGFEWYDKSNMDEKRTASVVVIHEDMAINYLTGQAGNMLYRMDKDIFRVDFARYINNSSNYVFDPGASMTKPDDGRMYPPRNVFAELEAE